MTMTDSPTAPPIPAPTPDAPLPHTHILTYITRTDTAPHLRRTIHTSLILLAILHALLAAWLVYHTQQYIRPTLFGTTTYIGPLGMPPVPWSARLRMAIYQNLPDLLLILLTTLAAAIYLLTANRASHGRPLAATFALAALALSILAALLTAAIAAGVALIMGFLNKGFDPDPLLNLLLAAPAALVALLLKDLAACILWAARNPMFEKPPTPFLPRRHRL
jgi:hypothetical protein